MSWIVELKDAVWIIPPEPEPDRTVIGVKNPRKFATWGDANDALQRARKFSTFEGAKITEVERENITQQEFEFTAEVRELYHIRKKHFPPEVPKKEGTYDVKLKTESHTAKLIWRSRDQFFRPVFDISIEVHLAKVEWWCES